MQFWSKELLYPQYLHDKVLWQGSNLLDFQMEQLFDLQQVPTLQKVTIASLYLEPDQFVWYQWLCDTKNDSIISWSIFTKELIPHYGDINSNTFFI